MATSAPRPSPKRVSDLFAAEKGGVEPVADETPVQLLDRLQAIAPTLKGFSGPVGASKAEREASAFGSGRVATGTAGLLDYIPEPSLQRNGEGVFVDSQGNVPDGDYLSIMSRDGTNRSRQEFNEGLIADDEERQVELTAVQDQERAIEAERQKMAFAADKAARDQAFFEEYGFESSPQANAEVIKHNSAAALSEGLAQDLDAYDQMEEKELAGLGPGAAGGRLGIQKKYDNLRRLRLIAMGFSSGVNPGTSLREPTPPKPADEMLNRYTGGGGLTR